MLKAVARSYKVQASAEWLRRTRRRLDYRFTTAPDGFPLPPAELQYLITHNFDVSAAHFLKSGEDHANQIDQWLTSVGAPLAKSRSVLDFGCGCGRVLRHLKGRTNASLHGCDYNPTLIGWCQRHLPVAQYRVNGLAPPLPYDAGQFDVVYALSVFTHLSAPLQREWFAELARVVRPNGHAIITVLGDLWLHRLTEDERGRLAAGEVIVRDANLAGRNDCAAFHSAAAVEALARGFTIAKAVPAGGTDAIQDAYVLRRR
jgi:SAM-dependent methyltransferase